MYTIYASATCSPCRFLERFVRSMPPAAQAQISIRDVTNDLQAKRDMLATGYMATPLLVTDFSGKLEAYTGAPEIIRVLNQQFGGR